MMNLENISQRRMMIDGGYIHKKVQFCLVNRVTKFAFCSVFLRGLNANQIRLLVSKFKISIIVLEKQSKKSFVHLYQQLLTSIRGQ